jgi:hypothetical protein
MEKVGANGMEGETMKIYLISQTQSRGYDTYDSAVVIARSVTQARHMDPSHGNEDGEPVKDWRRALGGAWCNSPDKVTVEYLGAARRGSKPGVVVSSFNAA